MSKKRQGGFLRWLRGKGSKADNTTPATPKITPAKPASILFTQENRQDVDVQEAEFGRFWIRVGEVEEQLVDQYVVDTVHRPHLLERPLQPEEITALRELAPWGYCFRLNADVSIDNVLSDDFTPHAFDQGEGMMEMDLRISMLEGALARYVDPEFPPGSGRWLDVATNCGIIPLLLNRQRGHVLTALDLASINLRKAKRLCAMAGGQDMAVIQADAYDFFNQIPDAAYDMISVLGLLYHLTDPVGLLSRVYRKVRRVVLIDSIVHNFDFSGWIQTVGRHIKMPEMAHAYDTRQIMELHPTCRGLVDTLFQVGFDRVVEVAPSPALLTHFPAPIYMSRNRKIFLAFKDAAGK